jgi:DNA-binding transcriptional LysR family regulator
MLDWNDFRFFLATARSGSTLGAARVLGVNQATVARRLDALEAALGARLFDRGQTGSKLTEAGEALLPSAEALELAAEKATKLAASLGRGASGALRVTANETTASVGLMPVLGEFRRLYPDIQVEVIVGDQMFDLAAGEADVAIRGAVRMDDSSLVARKLADTPWGLYCSRSYAEANGRPRTVEEIRHHAVIGPDAELARAPAMAWMMEHADPARVLYRCTSLTNLVAALKAGLGVAPLPNITAALEPDLVTCLPPQEHLQTALYVVTTPELRDTPRVRAFIDFITPIILTRIRTIFAEAAARDAAYDAA